MAQLLSAASQLLAFDPALVYEPLLDRGLIPDVLMRSAVRYFAARRLASLALPPAEMNDAKLAFARELAASKKIALDTDVANEQHYEVPTAFFETCLGKRMKYSACWFEDGAKTLEDAEDAMLAKYAERAGIVDGMDLLDLGCGWGSLSLYLCEKFPNAKITSVSNSRTQKEFIMARAAERGFKNIQVITADVNEFSTELRFDRACSIEMFEHMKDYSSLFAKIHGWLKPGGKLFVHIFCTRDMPYNFVVDGKFDWMSKYFFTSGTMPSSDLFLYMMNAQHGIKWRFENRWIVNGKNYGETGEKWLENLDRNKPRAMQVLREAYGSDTEATTWFNRWRTFYIAVAEWFSYAEGNEYIVAHYLFAKE